MNLRDRTFGECAEFARLYASKCCFHAPTRNPGSGFKSHRPDQFFLNELVIRQASIFLTTLTGTLTVRTGSNELPIPGADRARKEKLFLLNIQPIVIPVLREP